jgi:hypothetical protein
MAVTVAIETPLQDDVRKLVAQLNEHLLPLSPLEFQFKMTVEQMADAATTVFVARDEVGTAIGCGALKLAGDGTPRSSACSPILRCADNGSARRCWRPSWRWRATKGFRP